MGLPLATCLQGLFVFLIQAEQTRRISRGIFLNVLKMGLMDRDGILKLFTTNTFNCVANNI